MKGSGSRIVQIVLCAVTGSHELLHVSGTVTCCTACGGTMPG